MSNIETYNERKEAFCCPHCGAKIDITDSRCSVWDLPYDITDAFKQDCEECGKTFYWLIGITKELEDTQFIQVINALKKTNEQA